MKGSVGFKKRKLKFSATLNDETLPELNLSDYELQYIDIGNVNSYGFIHDPVTYKFEAAPSRARRVVRHGDVIISTVRTYLQAIAPIEDPPDNLIVSTGFAVVRPRASVLNGGFCKYALREKYFLWEVESRSVGVSYPAINAKELADICIYLPPLDIQVRIADYLDNEISRIDDIASEKENILALLDEKRAALISRAVTRGLNPNVRMENSDLEWLSEKPEHWKVCQLKRSWASSDYGLSESIRDEGEIGVLRMSCIVNGRIDESKSGMISQVDESLLLRKDDLLFNRTNSLDQIAKVGIVDFDPDRPLSFASYLVRIRVNKRALPKFLVYLLNSRQFLRYARKNAIPAIGQANLSPSRYGDLRIPLPPLREQELIVRYLDKEEKPRICLQDQIQQSIDLLRERRAALITAAVTGRIVIEGQAA